MAARDGEKQVTLQHLAEAAGVSRTTASNAFNRPDQLSQAMRDNILAIAQRLKYPGPNPMARKLRLGRVGAIGLVFGDSLTFAFSDSAAISFLLGVGQACQSAGNSLLLIPTTDADAGQAMIADAIVDGFIVYTTPNGDAVRQVLGRNLPVVTVDRTPLPGYPAVRLDDYAGARLAAEHLLGLGHRQLAIIAPRLHPNPFVGIIDERRVAAIAYVVCSDRLAGYRDAISAAGLNPASVPVDERPSNSEHGGYEAAVELLGRSPRPTGILAMSDRLAIGAMQAVQDLGLQAPDDVSIVGFDDIAAAGATRPGLTTIRQPLVDKGVRAVEQLLSGTLETPPPLPVTLIARGSTGPAPDNAPPVTSLRRGNRGPSRQTAGGQTST